jgi:hypothetical protein
LSSVVPLLFLAQLAVATPEDLSAARALIDELEFTRAIAEIEQRLASDLPLAARLEACELLALAWSAKNDVEEAKRAYVRLLRLDPGRSVDATSSPKMRTAFEAAQKELAEHPPELFDVRISREADRLRVSGRLDDPLAIVTDVRIDEVHAPVADHGFVAVLPDRDARQVVLSARAASGFEVGRSVQIVVQAPVEAPAVEAEPIMPWWGWTILGVAAASGVAVGVYFAVRPDDVVGEVVAPQP